MKINRKHATALATIVAAVATAHLMQKSGAEASRASVKPETVQTASVLPSVIEIATPKPAAPVPATIQIDEAATAAPSLVGPEPAAEMTPTASVQIAAIMDDPKPEMVLPVLASDIPSPPSEVLNPAPLPNYGAALRDRMQATAKPAATVADAPKRNEFGLTCGTVMSASIKPSAMVGLTLTSPCRSDDRITVRHSGLSYSAQMSNLGTYTVQVPALMAEAEFTVTFDDGEVASTIIDVPEMDGVERVVLQSTVGSGLQIHALEFGADYGEAGHIWSGTPSDPATAALTNGGFMTVMGDPALDDAQIAEVYTFPASAGARDGIVRLSIEAEVTALNCDKDVSGQIMQERSGGVLKPVSLTVSIPGCDAVGEYLVLKNLLRDLKVASN